MRRPRKRSENHLQITQAYRKRRPVWYMLAQAKSRAKKMGLPFDLREEDISIPEFCPLLGLKLERAEGKAKPNSPSLDRIRPERGYVRGNVWIISFKANTIKNNSTLEELELIVSALRNMNLGGDL